MPLDARKSQHLQQVVTNSFAGRQRFVVIVYRGRSSYSYSLVLGIMRPEQIVDPQIFSTGGQALPRASDTLMVVPLGTSFVGAVYVADTTTATASAVVAAPKYEIVEVLPVGILPGGSHLRVMLRRMR